MAARPSPVSGASSQAATSSEPAVILKPGPQLAALQQGNLTVHALCPTLRLG